MKLGILWIGVIINLIVSVMYFLNKELYNSYGGFAYIAGTILVIFGMLLPSRRNQ